MRRRDFITLLGGAAAAWPITASAQQPALPVIAFVNARSPENGAPFAAAFRKGLGEAGYVDGQNVILEYYWLGGQYDRPSELMADLVRRGVTVIATPGSNPAALAAKTATTAIPIVFGVGVGPIQLGLVASLARPGGNATGVNFFVADLTAKRLGLLHELVPKAARIAVLVNPSNAPVAESTARDVPEAARASACKLRCSRPAPAATSRRHLQRLCASRPTLSSSPPRLFQQPAR
jgi:putative tryptophan/tyrosine transport system substrate-binding protein